MRALLDNMPLETIQKCARRAREYELSYLTLLNDANADLKLNEIEKMKKDVKGKRCALEQDTSVVNNLVNLLEEDKDFDQNTKVILVDVDIFQCKKDKLVETKQKVKN